MRDTRGMWNRCISAAPRGSWSGCTLQGPSLSTFGQTRYPQRRLFSPSASNPLRSPAGPTSTWTGWANCDCSSARKIRQREECTVSASRTGRYSSRQCLKGTSAEKSQPSSMSWSTTDQEQIHGHYLV